jgi:hypothetical protein
MCFDNDPYSLWFNLREVAPGANFETGNFQAEESGCGINNAYGLFDRIRLNNQRLCERKGRTMINKGKLAVYGIVFFACLLMTLSLTGISFGTVKGTSITQAEKGGESASGKPILLAEGKKRMIPLADSSANKVMAPPCTVTGVKGRMVTLRDFRGQLDTVEVVDVSGIRIGDKAVVKNGLLILGVVPE